MFKSLHHAGAKLEITLPYEIVNNNKRVVHLVNVQYYFHTSLLWPIVEETLTSGKYISLFLISNFIYIYIKLKKLRDSSRIFWKNTQKLCKWREQMHHFWCYSSSENINCHCIHAARKKSANNIKSALDFYYYSTFLYGNIWPAGNTANT